MCDLDITAGHQLSSSQDLGTAGQRQARCLGRGPSSNSSYDSTASGIERRQHVNPLVTGKSSNRCFSFLSVVFGMWANIDVGTEAQRYVRVLCPLLPT
jgi:hypothetical protein